MANEVNLFNKVITNHGVDLTTDEINVLRYTLNQVLSAGNTDFKYWRPSVDAYGNISWELDKSISPIGGANIHGADGVDGRTPVFSSNPANAHLVWAYEDAVETSGWSDIPYALSGQQGPRGYKGEPGAAGENGKTPELQVNENTELEWKYTDEAETEWRSLGLYASGNSGFSPTVTTEVIPTSEDPRGGYRLTFQYGPAGSQTQAVEIFNGTNGQGAQFTVSQGTGIEVTRNGNDFEVALNSDAQATLAQVPVLVAASADWDKVSQKFDTSAWDAASGRFVTSAGLQDDIWYLFTTSGWKPSDSVMTTVVTDTTLSGNGWDSSPLGIAQNVREITFSAGYADEAKYASISKKDNDEIPIYDYLKFVKDNQNLFIKEFVRIDNTLSGTGLDSEHNLGINGTLKSQWDSAYAVTEAYKSASSHFMQSVNVTQNGGLSGNGGLTAGDTSLGIDEAGMTTDHMYGWKKGTGWSEVETGGDYLPLSGGTVTGRTNFSAATGQNILAVASVASLVGASRQTEANFGQNNNAMGTTWMGVGGFRGFLKYTQGGNVGDLDSNNTIQVEFTPNNKGTIFAKTKNSGNDCPETQILNPTKSSCDAMTTSGNANLVSGPNYLIAKNADGQFTIGAGFVNCTDMNNVTLTPNTYYFVYEV